jgi:hypothetical protein
MHISIVAMNRMAETQAEKDPSYKEGLKRHGKMLLSDARKLGDAELLGKLAIFNIRLDRESFPEQCTHALSAEDLGRSLAQLPTFRPASRVMDEDWLWLGLTVLWQRWCPNVPSFERLDDRMQEGYLLRGQNSAEACDRWLEAWSDVVALAEKGSFRSLTEFDGAFGGTQSVFNWVQDAEMELQRAGWKNPVYQRRRIGLCEEFLRRFVPGNSLLLENMRRAMAGACIESGDRARGDALYEQWLRTDPQWGWGWIGWSDCYGLFAPAGTSDFSKAEALLKQGLGVKGVRDRDYILDRLAQVYEEQGRHQEASQARLQNRSASKGNSVRAVHRIKSKVDFGEEGLPLDKLPEVRQHLSRAHDQMLGRSRARKAGRNEPCPCGSGKKFKYCCSLPRPRME